MVSLGRVSSEHSHYYHHLVVSVYNSPDAGSQNCTPELDPGHTRIHTCTCSLIQVPLVCTVCVKWSLKPYLEYQSRSKSKVYTYSNASMMIWWWAFHSFDSNRGNHSRVIQLSEDLLFVWAVAYSIVAQAYTDLLRKRTCCTRSTGAWW